MEKKETAGKTDDVEDSEVDCQRPVDTRDNTGDCKEHSGNKIQGDGWLETCKDKGDCRNY